jgi:putative membrane protein
MPALSAVVSAFHLLALAIGLPAVLIRGAALRGPLDAAGLRRVLLADNAWGLAALMWLATGLWRAFGTLEKGAPFYFASSLFHMKLGLFAVILLLELRPMVALIRWRITLQRGGTPDVRQAPLYATLSTIEAAIVVTMVFVAAFMARGFGLRG